ncbi:MAG: hypothetical protein WCG73_02000 [Candidatus Moraniibacteriota bacterium]
MKFLFAFQSFLIGLSVTLLVALPVSSLFLDIGFAVKGYLFLTSFVAVSLVMLVRPLADIFSGQLWLRRLIFLRKGFGIFSASIIVGFMFSAIIAPESVYLASLFTAEFYSFDKYRFLAHIGDISGFILLITSNRFSQKLLGRNWKRIQKLSYVYFYAGGLYEAFALGNTLALCMVFVITDVALLAWIAKVLRGYFVELEAMKKVEARV